MGGKSVNRRSRQDEREGKAKGKSLLPEPRAQWRWGERVQAKSFLDESCSVG